MMSSLIRSNDIYRQEFDKQADAYIKSLNSTFQAKAVITQVMHDKIVRCLTNQCSSDFNTRFISWYRASFAVQKNGTKRLLCDAKSKKPVLLYESMYDVYKHAHIETVHAGRDRCLDSLSVNYSGYNHRLLELFIKNCSSCQRRKRIIKPMLSKPIIALGRIF